MEIIKKYFSDFTPRQLEQIQVLERLYPEWNSKINVISRKDIDNLEVNHILHSLAIARFIRFIPGTCVLDLGTGGGFPGIPLALCFPDVQFMLVDRTGKKLAVAKDVAREAGITNVDFYHGDVKEVKGEFHFVVSRAVMDLNDMVPLVRKLISREGHNALPNGLICLKGGDLEAEIRRFRKSVIVEDLMEYFPQEYFKSKKIVYLPI